MNLSERILKFKEIRAVPKYEGIVFAVIEAINDRELKVHGQFPSINCLKKKLGYSGVTICKGYEKLKKLGLVKSVQCKGYFVSSQNTETTTRIVLVSACIESYQEKLYRVFRAALGDSFSMDVFIYNNRDCFETILQRVKETGYDRYIIEPIVDLSLIPKLESFDPDKLLVLDSRVSLNERFFGITKDLNVHDCDRIMKHYG